MEPRQGPTPAPPGLDAGRIALLYAFAGLAWIALSGAVLGKVVVDPDVAGLFELGKGAGFVLVTATLLYAILARRSATIRSSQVELHAKDAALTRTSGELQAIIAAAPLAICTLDLDGRVSGWNPAAERVLGWKADEVLGNPCPAVPLEGKAAWEAIRTRVRSGESVEGLDLHGRRKDGRRVILATWAAPLRDGSGAVAGLLVISEDVTDRLEGEEERSRLATAVQQADEAIVITDRDGSIVYVNPAFERITGYTRAEVRGGNPRILNSGRQDAAFYAAMWAKLTAGETWSGTFVNRRKDGTLFEEDAVITPLRDAADRVVNYVGVKRDVTREHALERQVGQAQRMEAVGQLAGGIAHDFNNLLTAIGGYAELLRDELVPSDPRRADAEEVVRASGRAATLVKQLLAVSRRQLLEPIVLDVNGLVRDLEPMVRRLLGETATLAFHPDPSLAPVFADPGQLEQVLVNLTLNARDAMPEGGTFTIETCNVVLDGSYAQAHLPVTPGAYVLVTATDTGIGMTHETLARVFEPFFTTKPRGEGTGLGLSTAYGIVKQSGGYLWAYSEPGEGTSFKLYLPQVEGSVRAIARMTAADAVRGGSETILLVEDEAGVRTFAQTALERLGYRVLAASGGHEALRMARAEPGAVDLLITDVVMPEMGGSVVAAKLGELRPGTRTLFVSGYTEDTVVRRGVLTSEVAFLSKPFGADALGRRVRDLLDRPPGA